MVKAVSMTCFISNSQRHLQAAFVLIAGLGLAMSAAFAASENCEILLMEGEAAMSAGNLVSAEAAFSSAVIQGRSDRAPGCRVDALAALSRALEADGQIDAAAQVLEDRLDLRRDGLSPGHPDLALDLYGAAGFYLEHDQPSRAATHLEAVLLIDIGVFGPEHPLIGDSLMFLALLYEEADRDADARRSYEGALLVYEKIFPADHADLGRALSRYGELLARLGEDTLSAEFSARAAATKYVPTGG